MLMTIEPKGLRVATGLASILARKLRILAACYIQATTTTTTKPAAQ